MQTQKKHLKLLLTVLILSLSQFLIAQSDSVSSNSSDLKKKDEVKTLFGSKGSNGFLMGFDMELTSFDDQEAFEIGGRIGGIVGHDFAIGGQGLALYGNNVTVYRTSDTIEVDLNGGYGGIFFQPIILPKFPVHISIPLFIGVGAAGYDASDDFGDWDGDAFLVFRPGVELEFNLVKFMKLNLGVHYRYIYGMNRIEGVNQNSLNGITAGMSLIFGKF